MCNRFDECTRRFDKIDATLEQINTRLFKGNGKDSWDIQLDRLNSFRKTHDERVGKQNTRIWAAIYTIATALIVKLSWGWISGGR